MVEYVQSYKYDRPQQTTRRAMISIGDRTSIASFGSSSHSTDDGKMNSRNRAAIKSFEESLSDVTEITVSVTTNPCLYPFYEHVKYNFGEVYAGIAIVDKQGVYTPIEEYSDNVIHLVRLPRTSVPVYAITDMRSIVYTKYKQLTIVFQGVYRTPNRDYDFISNEFFIRPAPSLSFGMDILVLHAYRIDGKDDVVYEEEGGDFG